MKIFRLCRNFENVQGGKKNKIFWYRMPKNFNGKKKNICREKILSGKCLPEKCFLGENICREKCLPEENIHQNIIFSRRKYFRGIKH